MGAGLVSSKHVRNAGITTSCHNLRESLSSVRSTWIWSFSRTSFLDPERQEPATAFDKSPVEKVPIRLLLRHALGLRFRWSAELVTTVLAER
jgi:hypothetical protein